ncbi:MAG: hypothetical protein R3Y24_11485 [Eubacteriales bacterium]
MGNIAEYFHKEQEELQFEQFCLLEMDGITVEVEVDVIKEFNYIHYNSGEFCYIYAIGYTDNEWIQKEGFYQKIQDTCGATWYYSDKAFVHFKENLKRRIKWSYTGEMEMLLLQSNPQENQILDFRNYICIDISYGLKHEYLESFPKFMESLINSAKKEITIPEVIADMQKFKIEIKKIVQK